MVIFQIAYNMIMIPAIATTAAWSALPASLPPTASPGASVVDGVDVELMVVLVGTLVAFVVVGLELMVGSSPRLDDMIAAELVISESKPRDIVESGVAVTRPTSVVTDPVTETEIVTVPGTADEMVSTPPGPSQVSPVSQQPYSLLLPSVQTKPSVGQPPS